MICPVLLSLILIRVLADCMMAALSWGITLAIALTRFRFVSPAIALTGFRSTALTTASPWLCPISLRPIRLFFLSINRLIIRPGFFQRLCEKSLLIPSSAGMASIPAILCRPAGHAAIFPLISIPGLASQSVFGRIGPLGVQSIPLLLRDSLIGNVLPYGTQGILDRHHVLLVKGRVLILLYVLRRQGDLAGKDILSMFLRHIPGRGPGDALSHRPPPCADLLISVIIFLIAAFAVIPPVVIHLPAVIPVIIIPVVLKSAVIIAILWILTVFLRVLVLISPKLGGIQINAPHSLLLPAALFLLPKAKSLLPPLFMDLPSAAGILLGVLVRPPPASLHQGHQRSLGDAHAADGKHHQKHQISPHHAQDRPQPLGQDASHQTAAKTVLRGADIGVQDLLSRLIAAAKHHLRQPAQDQHPSHSRRHLQGSDGIALVGHGKACSHKQKNRNEKTHHPKNPQLHLPQIIPGHAAQVKIA